MNMRQIYRALLRLYPGDYRSAFSSEMLATFDKVAEERLRTGLASARFALPELSGLLLGAAVEWMAKFGSTRTVRSEALDLPDEVMEAQDRVSFLVTRIEYAIAHHDFSAARSYCNEESRERENLQILRHKYNLDA
jgi:hypothetical protein